MGRKDVSRVESVRSQVVAENGSDLDIRRQIFTVRGVQVMLDRDLAELYKVPTKRLNEQVKRNAERFPAHFMFRLSAEDLSLLRSQFATSNETALLPESLRSQFATSKRGGARYAPYVFTEHGIAMLASVLNSPVAIETSVRIIDAFVSMRRILASLAPMLARIEVNERRQISDQAKNEERFNEIFDALRDKQLPLQKVFYDGQVYDAKAFAAKHILSAKKSILLIDSWVDVVTLEMLAKKKRGVTIEIVASPRGNHLAASDIAAFNAQYGGLSVRTSVNYHDRFVIIDDKELYLFGASLKDLGKKCFAFTKLDASEIPGLKART